MEKGYVGMLGQDAMKSRSLASLGMTDLIAIVVLIWVELHLNPHPLIAEGAAPKCRFGFARASV